MKSLVEARGELVAAVRSGERVECPCCHQTVKMYSKKIHRGLWAALNTIARHNGLRSRELLLAMGSAVSTDFGQLAHWHLIEKRGGYWFLTTAGRAFLEGRMDIPKYAYTLNGEVEGYSDTRVTAQECREKFDLAEEMDPANLAA